MNRGRLGGHRGREVMAQATGSACIGLLILWVPTNHEAVNNTDREVRKSSTHPATVGRFVRLLFDDANILPFAANHAFPWAIVRGHDDSSVIAALDTEALVFLALRYSTCPNIKEKSKK